MGLFDFLRRGNNLNEVEKGVSIQPLMVNSVVDTSFGVSGPVEERAISKSVVPAGAGDIAQIPWLPFNWDYIESLYYNSDILRTTIQLILNETFGNGLKIESKFVKKCAVCGTEYNHDIDKCRVCGSTDFKEPDKRQRDVLEFFIDKANINNQPLIQVLRDLDHNINVFDNGYLVVRKKYEYNESGELISSKVLEIFSGDPKHTFLIMSNDGRPGLTRDGQNMVFVCPEHRENPVLVSVEELIKNPEYIPRCPKCGKKMLKAVAVHDSGGKKIYYADGEILHVKKFTSGVGYGYPMILTLLKKLLILLKQDWFILTAYHMQRPPRGLLIIRADRNAVAKAFATARSEAYKNPWNIVPLVISGTEKVVSKRIVEWLDLTYKPDEITFTSFRQEIRRVIMAAWQVSPVFQGEVNTGISNEGLQITITNRAVMREQSLINDVLRWLVKQLKVTDWVIKLNPNEPMDVKGKLDRIMKRINIARTLTEMGFEVELVQGGIDGLELEFKGTINIKERLKRDLEIWAKEKRLNIKFDDLVDVLEVLPKVGLSFERFKRLMLLAALVGGVDNMIRNIEQQLNIPPLEQILYRIKYPNAEYLKERSGNYMVDNNGQAGIGVDEENVSGEQSKEEEDPFNEWLEQIASAPVEDEQSVSGEPEGSNEMLYNENKDQKFGGQTNMNRSEMPGMDALYGRNE